MCGILLLLLFKVLVGLDDLLNQAVTNDIAGLEFDDANRVDLSQSPYGVTQSTGDASWSVLLGSIAADHHFATFTHAGQEHLHLGDGCVLCFV